MDGSSQKESIYRRACAKALRPTPQHCSMTVQTHCREMGGHSPHPHVEQTARQTHRDSFRGGAIVRRWNAVADSDQVRCEGDRVAKLAIDMAGGPDPTGFGNVDQIISSIQHPAQLHCNVKTLKRDCNSNLDERVGYS